ncbi:MAG: hypothetical protein LBQ79_12030 [Deltaproteobacteria bacterium]|jgi:hypothetical protein|nr:hypothetical protein [Deltaproteobacteria bacterium]
MESGILYRNLLDKLDFKTSDMPYGDSSDDIGIASCNFTQHFSKSDSGAITCFISDIDERQIIKDAIQEYAYLNVNLKPNVRSSITIQGEFIKFTIRRYLLTPVSQEDRSRLFQLEGRYGVHPLDKLIGIANLPFKITVNAMLKVCEKAQEARSFLAASNNLRDDCDIKLDACTVSDVTSHVGNIVFQHDMEKAEHIHKLSLDGTLPFPAEKYSGVLYLQADGAMVHTREKTNDDSDSGWREHKLGMVFDSGHMLNMIRKNRHVKERIQHKILKKEYSSNIGSATEFGKLFFENAYRNGYGTFQNTVVLSDGADWISNMVLVFFPDAEHILDYHHVSEKILDLGKLYFKKDQVACGKWCARICDEILESGYDRIRQEIVKLERPLKTIKVSGFLDKNFNIIDYKSYLKSGYCIDSGALEGSNMNIVRNRLKISGMRWNLASAQALAILRCKKESHRWHSDVVNPVRKKYELPCI